MAEERLQKILARAGIASRRAAEQLMLDGRVTVNGQRADRLGMHADPDRDQIKVNGRLIASLLAGPRQYFLAFKPRNMITTLSDPEGRPTIADLLQDHGIRARVYPVGRLDWDADGLLILTNDGELANQVMHPRTHLPKLYRVKVRGVPDDRDLDRVRRGVMIEPGVRTLPAEISVEELADDATWLRITLEEGRQNQLKRMFELIGHPVRRIRRLAIGPLRLGRLKVGQVRPMTEDDLHKLRKAIGRAEAGLEVETPYVPPRRTAPRGARATPKRGGGPSAKPGARATAQRRSGPPARRGNRSPAKPGRGSS
jgi:pseudouridine synthase